MQEQRNIRIQSGCWTDIKKDMGVEGCTRKDRLRMALKVAMGKKVL